MNGNCTHKIKVNEDAFIDLVSGRKTFEVRDNDRLYQVGDILEIATAGGRKCHATIKYIHSDYDLDYGFVVLGLGGVEEIKNINPKPSTLKEQESRAKRLGLTMKQKRIPESWLNSKELKAWYSCSAYKTEYSAMRAFLDTDEWIEVIENGYAIYVTGPHDHYHVTGEDVYHVDGHDYDEPKAIVNTECLDDIPEGWEQVEVWCVQTCDPTKVRVPDGKNDYYSIVRLALSELLEEIKDYE